MHLINQLENHQILSTEPIVDPTSLLNNCLLGDWVSIGPRNKLTEAKIGDYSYTMDDVTINYAQVGKFTSIASHVCINPSDHPMHRVTQHHITYRGVNYGLSEDLDKEVFDMRRNNKVDIGNDVWIGHGAIILKNVTIGDGAVIGAGAIVTKNVAPYTVIVGSPANPIKMRFKDDIIKSLLRIKWWQWPDEIIRQRFHELNDIKTFIEKYDRHE